MVIVAGTIGAAVISTILRPLADKVATVSMDYGDKFVHIKREMSSLRSILRIIEGALPEANEKNVDNQSISDWLRDLDDICYEALDVLDEFVTAAAQPVTSNSILSSVSCAFSKVKSIRRIQLAKDISSLRERLDKMKEDMETAKLLTFGNVGGSQNAAIITRPTTSPLLNKQRDLFVGREVEKEEIMEKLLNYNDQMENVRHMCITYDSNFWKNLSLCNTKRLRTLCILDDYSIHDLEKNVQDIFKRLKSIRVLVLVTYKIRCIPKSIRKLIHLRYLDISETGVSTIPDALCDLYNLQTLAVPCGFYRAVLPKNIVNMSNMRHLRARLSTCKGVKNLTSLQELYSISVCKDDDISELGDLRQLRGKLIIEDLKNVTRRRDASKARMKENTHIDHLELNFSGGLGDSDDQITVLDALECPPNLTNLKIDSYQGLTPPSWMKDGKLIARLQSLDLSRCYKLESLPPLGQLDFLKHLHFKSLNAIRRLDDEFYGTQFQKNVFFPSLESLKLTSMDNLEGWDGTVTRDNSVICFPCLTSLDIFRCPKLVSALPPVASNINIMRNLSDLEIRDCGGPVELKLDVLVSLKHLTISCCSNLKRVTSVELPSKPCCLSVKTLDVFRCNELMSFPRLVAIESLDIQSCEKLSSLSISLQRLKFLTVYDCLMLEPTFEDEPTSPSSSMLSSLPPSRLEILRTNNVRVLSKLFQHDLVFLKKMHIVMFSKVKCFDKIVENNWHKLTSLETLQISHCVDLESLPPDTQQLSSLKKLWLYVCPKLQALPDEGLPLSLEVLEIVECSLLLYERCQAESGLDWHKIKHIRERKIIKPEE